MNDDEYRCLGYSRWGWRMDISITQCRSVEKYVNMRDKERDSNSPNFSDEMDQSLAFVHPPPIMDCRLPLGKGWRLDLSLYGWGRPNLVRKGWGVDRDQRGALTNIYRRPTDYLARWTRRIFKFEFRKNKKGRRPHRLVGSYHKLRFTGIRKYLAHRIGLCCAETYDFRFQRQDSCSHVVCRCHALHLPTSRFAQKVRR